MVIVIGADVGGSVPWGALSLTVKAVKATPVEVPLNFVMGTSRGAFSRASLLLIDLETAEGVVGRSYIFSHMAAVSRALVRPPPRQSRRPYLAS